MTSEDFMWPEYEALDETGLPYMRAARVVHELPTGEERTLALESARVALEKLFGLSATKPLGFGQPVFVAFGLTRNQAKAHMHARLLLTRGDDVPLVHCEADNGS